MGEILLVLVNVWLYLLRRLQSQKRLVYCVIAIEELTGYHNILWIYIFPGTATLRSLTLLHFSVFNLLLDLEWPFL